MEKSHTWEEANRAFGYSDLPPSWAVRHLPIKRTFDILFSILVLLIGFPVFFLIALCVRLSSRGKVFYAQERVGRGGKTFKCYKFRTMYADADEKLQHLLKNNPDLHKEWHTYYKLKQDPRITPIGIFLRKASLDELPQFWNVLKGDLSVVGPRPIVHEEAKKYFGHKVTKIFSVRPGLTGAWQVSGRSDTSYDRRIALDEMYVDNQSLLLDIAIIAKTVPAMLSSKGAY